MLAAFQSEVIPTIHLAVYVLIICSWELLSSESYYYLILLKIPFVFLKKKKGFFISGDGCYFIDISLTSPPLFPSFPVFSKT